MKNVFIISTGSIIKIAILVGLIALGFLLSDLLIAILVAVILASAVEPIIIFAKKYKIPRSVSVPFIFIFGLSLILSSLALFIPKIAKEASDFFARLPGLIDNVKIFGLEIVLVDISNYIKDLSNKLSEGQIINIIKNFFLGAGSALKASGVFISNLFNTILIFILSFYLAIQERGVESFLRLVVPKEYEDYAISLWDKSQKKISGWARGQILLAFVIGILIYISLKIVGIPYAGVLAVIAGVGELIPVVGLTIAMIPALLVALSEGGIVLLGIVFLIYFIVGQIENHILYPNIMNKLVGVPSIIIIISLIVGAKLAGFWGVLISVPIAAIIIEFLNDLDSHRLKKENV